MLAGGIMRNPESILSEIEEITAQYAYNKTEITQINTEIERLRRRLSTLRGDQETLFKNKRTLNKELESAERQLELQREQARIATELNKIREQSETIRANALWLGQEYDWQFEGALKLASAKRGLLADVRGMGKTFSAIIWRRLVGSKKTLVATRKRYAEEFIKELALREPKTTVVPLLGSNPVARKVMIKVLAQSYDDLVVITNFETWRRNPKTVAAEYLQMGFDSIILDEAHHVKNAATGTAKGYHKIAHNTGNILDMTGTPIRNRPIELFSILHGLYPDVFPTENAFRRDYCTLARDEWGQVIPNKWVFTELGLENLLKKIGSFYVARTPSDVGHNIPPPNVIHYKLDFEGYDEQREAYQQVAERSLLEIKSQDKVLGIPGILAQMTRLRQMTSWPAGIKFEIKNPETKEVLFTMKFDVKESAKVDWAEELVKELIEEGHRIVLFSSLKGALYELNNRLAPQARVAMITGDNSRSQQYIINDFDLKMADPDNYKYDILLATYGTVGESVNLNAARHCILFDRYWNPASDDQAIGRLDRLNSVDQATIHMGEIESTIDTYMRELIEEKRDLITGFKSAAAVQQGLIKNLEESIK